MDIYKVVGVNGVFREWRLVEWLQCKAPIVWLYACSKYQCQGLWILSTGSKPLCFQEGFSSTVDDWSRARDDGEEDTTEYLG